MKLPLFYMLANEEIKLQFPSFAGNFVSEWMENNCVKR